MSKSIVNVPADPGTPTPALKEVYIALENQAGTGDGIQKISERIAELLVAELGGDDDVLPSGKEYRLGLIIQSRIEV